LEDLTHSRIHLYHHRNNAFHHVFCIYEGSTIPFFHLTAAAHESMWVSADKAVRELANAIVFCPHFRLERRTENVYDAIDHYGYYHPADRAKEALAWIKNAKEVEWPAEQGREILSLETLCDKCADEFGEISIIDMTPEYLEKTPYRLVRIMTELGIPFWFGGVDLPKEKTCKKGQTLDWGRWVHPMG
jgi:hypothetical protein